MTVELPPQPTIEPECDRQHSWLNFPADRVGPYNNWDCVATALCRRELPKILEQSRNADYFAQWFSTVVPVALNMQRRGFGHLDRGRLTTYTRQLNSELGELEKTLLTQTQLFAEMKVALEEWHSDHLARDRAAAEEKNLKRKTPLAAAPLTREKQRQTGYESRLRKIAEARDSFLNSPLRKATWLFDELSLKPAPKAHKRPPRSTDQRALQHIYRHLRVKDQPHAWILEDLVHRSRLNTIRTRYLDIPTGPGDRIYPHVRVYASETLRWSYSNPPLHQWVPEIRHLVVARPGFVFIGADWKALEARLQSYFAGEQKDIEAFEDDARDIHIETALEIFRLHGAITPVEVEILRDQRRQGAKPLDAYAAISPDWAALSKANRDLHRGFGKTKRYEKAYGGSGLGNQAKVFCFCSRPQCANRPQMMSLPPSEQKLIMKRWEASRPATARWMRDLFDSVIANGKRWTSPFGYTRQFFGPADELKTTILNCPMQTTAGELLNRVVVELDRLGAPLVFQHHDQPVLEVPNEPGAISEYSAMLKETMEAPISELGGVQFPVDLHVGESWSDLK